MVDIRSLSDETKKSIVKAVNALKYAAGFSSGEIENYVLAGEMPEIVYNALNKVLNEKFSADISSDNLPKEKDIKISSFTAEQMIEVTTAIYETKLQNQSAKNAATVTKIDNPDVIRIVNETKNNLAGFIDNANKALATLKSNRQNSTLSTKELEVLKKDIANLGSMVLAAKKSYIILNAVATYKDKFSNVLTPVSEFITKGDINRLNESLRNFSTANSSPDPTQKAQAYARGKSIQTFLNNLSNSGTISKLNKIKTGADEIKSQIAGLNKRQAELEKKQTETSIELKKIADEQERIKLSETATKQEIDNLNKKQAEYEKQKQEISDDLFKIKEQLKNATGYLKNALENIMEIKKEQANQQNLLEENKKEINELSNAQQSNSTRLETIENKQEENEIVITELDKKLVELDKAYKADKRELNDRLLKIEEDNVQDKENIQKQIADLDNRHSKEKEAIIDQITEINSEQVELKAEQKNLRAELRQNKRLIEKLQEANEEIIENQNELEEKYTELKAKSKEQEKAVKQLQEKNAEILEEQANLDSSIKGINSEIKKHSSEIETINGKNEELNKKHDELVRTYNEDKQKIATILEKVNETLTAYEKSLAEIKEAQTKAATERQNNADRVNGQDKKIAELEARNATLDRRIVELTDELSTLRDQVQGIISKTKETTPEIIPVPVPPTGEDTPSEGNKPTPEAPESGDNGGNDGGSGESNEPTEPAPNAPEAEPVPPTGGDVDGDADDGSGDDGNVAPPSGGSGDSGNGGTGSGNPASAGQQPNLDPIDADPVETEPIVEQNPIDISGSADPANAQAEGNVGVDEIVPGAVRTAKTRKLSAGRKFINFLGRHWLLAATILGAVGLTAAAFLGPAGAGAALSVAHFAVYNIITFGAIGATAAAVKYLAFRKRRQANAAQSHFLNRERKVQRRIRKSDKNLAKIKSLQSQIDNIKILASEAKTGSWKYKRFQKQIKSLRNQQIKIDEENVNLLLDINKEFAPVKNRFALNPMNLVYRTRAMLGAARLNEYHSEHAKFVDRRSAKKPAKQEKLASMKLNGNLTDEDLNYQIARRKYYENLKQRMDELKSEPKRTELLKQLEGFHDRLKSNVVPNKAKDRFDERAEERKVLGVVAKDIITKQNPDIVPEMNGAEKKEIAIYTNAEESSVSKPGGNYTGQSAIVITLPDGTKRKYGSEIGQRYIDIKERSADGIPPVREEGRSR